jgi:hypothetical protein
MKNNDIGASFQKLLFDGWYRYLGVRALKLPDNKVEVKGRIMTIEEFHEYVDGAYESIDKSLDQGCRQYDCPIKS